MLHADEAVSSGNALSIEVQVESAETATYVGIAPRRWYRAVVDPPLIRIPPGASDSYRFTVAVPSDVFRKAEQLTVFAVRDVAITAARLHFMID